LKVNGKHHLLVYADDVNILNGSIQTVKENTEMLVFASKEIGKGKGKSKSKAIPLQAGTGPEDSRRLRLPDFKTIGTYALAAFTPRKYSWYSFQLEAESTPGP
jgi:hypothetical protein